MKTFILDMALCGVIYVILIYFIFRLMRSKPQNNGGDGGVFSLSPPKIDLPPGISWSTKDSEISEKSAEEVF